MGAGREQLPYLPPAEEEEAEAQSHALVKHTPKGELDPVSPRPVPLGAYKCSSTHTSRAVPNLSRLISRHSA